MLFDFFCDTVVNIQSTEWITPPYIIDLWDIYIPQHNIRLSTHEKLEMSHYNLGFYGYKYWFHLFGILYQSIYDYVRLKIFLKKQLKMYVSQQAHTTLFIVINSISIFCASVELVNSVLGLLRELLRFTDCLRSGCKHSMSFKSVNMQNKHGGLIWLYDCYLKRCVKNSLTLYSFFVMESRVFSDCTHNIHRFIQGMKLTFFSDSHLAPKFCKVVTNSKKVGRHFQRNKIFLYAVSILDRPSKIKLGKRSLTCYKVDTRMDDIQRSGLSKSKMASSYRSRCMCYVLETNLTRKFVADLSLQIFLIHYISW